MTKRAQYGAIFIALGVVVCASLFKGHFRLTSTLYVWFALDLIFIGAAFVLNFPQIFGKRRTGELCWLNRIALLPFMFFMKTVRFCQNMTVTSAVFDEIVEGVYVGRLCAIHHIPRDVSVLVDLTAEFETPASIQVALTVVCIPTLDGGVPDWRQCTDAFEEIRQRKHRVYFCCANGYGRSVTCAAIWVGQVCKIESAVDVVTIIKNARPHASPNKDQMAFIEWALEQSRIEKKNKAATSESGL